MTRHNSGGCKGGDYKKCCVCGKELTRSSNLKRRIQLYTNEKDQAKVAPLCKNSHIYLNETTEKGSLLTLIHVFCCSQFQLLYSYLRE